MIDGDAVKLTVNAVGVATGILPNDVVSCPTTDMPCGGLGVMKTDDAVPEPILFNVEVNVNNEPAVGLDGRITVFKFIRFISLGVRKFSNNVDVSGWPFNIYEVAEEILPTLPEDGVKYNDIGTLTSEWGFISGNFIIPSELIRLIVLEGVNVSVKFCIG